MALMLMWQTHDQIPGAEQAVGLRGEYVVRRVPDSFVLTGYGHDTLPLLDLPPAGRKFVRLDDAKQFANQLERVSARESEVSGA
ncbi:hypothetical protein [Mycolicibacterium sp.]|uniref:hypothetical protein n=1 Tax=Mycolicibacterium sp. TaxID=2320850 RepID=UPI00355D73C5